VTDALPHFQTVPLVTFGNVEVADERQCAGEIAIG
jgi:hypothetical protein